MKNSIEENQIVFHTRSFYYEPMDKNVTILLQDLNGPCMLIAIINALILQGKIELKENQYDPESLNCILQAISPDAPDLSLLLTGFNINPCFSDCTAFKDYPVFLNSLGLKMVHSMVCDPRDGDYPYISELDYEAFQIELIDLSEGKINSDSKIDAFNRWNEKLKKQTTRYGAKNIKSRMKENEFCIYFRGNHFSVITKHDSNVYALMTDEIFAMTNCIWESIPGENGESVYYDTFFRPSEEVSSSGNCSSSAEFINSLIYQNENGSGNINPKATWYTNLQRNLYNAYSNAHAQTSQYPSYYQYRNQFNQAK